MIKDPRSVPLEIERVTLLLHSYGHVPEFLWLELLNVVVALHTETQADCWNCHPQHSLPENTRKAPKCKNVRGSLARSIGDERRIEIAVLAVKVASLKSGERDAHLIRA